MITIPQNELIKNLLEAIIKTAKENSIDLVMCGECKNYHSDIGWCDKHSHFIDDKGEACHPAESRVWTMFEDNDFCSYGERKERK